ncbi:hypothetical protein F4778DRAFT_801888 [Xylariomycetidae sp. FL2044]|nr:hypothetical protein F4778DRAFT_801888 [Xylariomycetidae sp. FL2044]
MKLETALLAVAGAASSILAIVHPRQDPASVDTQDLYLCSNPNFNKDCDGCACESLTDLVTSGGYSGPPCYPLPYDLRVGNPQGVSSAKSYSGWNCTLYDNEFCDDNGPGSTFNIPPGPPGARSLGPFDDRCVSYQCYTIPSAASSSSIMPLVGTPTS